MARLTMMLTGLAVLGTVRGQQQLFVSSQDCNASDSDIYGFAEKELLPTEGTQRLLRLSNYRDKARQTANLS